MKELLPRLAVLRNGFLAKVKAGILWVKTRETLKQSIVAGLPSAVAGAVSVADVVAESVKMVGTGSHLVFLSA
jgi:hypothetical protein